MVFFHLFSTWDLSPQLLSPSLHWFSMSEYVRVGAKPSWTTQTTGSNGTYLFQEIMFGSTKCSQEQFRILGAAVQSPKP
jgi:hypothetical protein